MKLTLELQDLQAIADLVTRGLDRRLSELLQAAQRRSPPVPPPLPAQQPDAARRTPVAGDVLRRSELERLTGLSATTLWRREREGQFPSRIRLSRGRVGWRRTDVEAWLSERQTV